MEKILEYGEIPNETWEEIDEIKGGHIVCSVCWENLNFFLYGKIYGENIPKEYQTIVCVGCRKFCHQGCYNPKISKLESFPLLNIEVNAFICDSCKIKGASVVKEEQIRANTEKKKGNFIGVSAVYIL